MAKGNTPSLHLVLLIAATLVATAVSDCNNDVQSLRQKCLQFVSATGPKTPPDRNCCGAVQKANIPCVCTYLTPPVEKLISADKVIYVARQCGRPLKSGTKCGSVTVPK